MVCEPLLIGHVTPHDDTLLSLLPFIIMLCWDVFANTWIAASRFLALSLTPGTISQKRSVLAVHKTITLSTPLDERKSLMSFLICSIWRTIEAGWVTPATLSGGTHQKEFREDCGSTCSAMVPLRTLSARLSWFAAMKSGMYIDGLGFMQRMYGSSCSCKFQSNTSALSIALPRSIEEISQPGEKNTLVKQIFLELLALSLTFRRQHVYYTTEQAQGEKNVFVCWNSSLIQ